MILIRNLFLQVSIEVILSIYQTIIKLSHTIGLRNSCKNPNSINGFHNFINSVIYEKLNKG
jgi:hypothetical protein